MTPDASPSARIRDHGVTSAAYRRRPRKTRLTSHPSGHRLPVQSRTQRRRSLFRPVPQYSVPLHALVVVYTIFALFLRSEYPRVTAKPSKPRSPNDDSRSPRTHKQRAFREGGHVMVPEVLVEQLAPVMRETSAHFQRMIDELDQLARLDFRTGVVDLQDEQRINDILLAGFGRDAGERYARGLRDVAREGLAVLIEDDQGSGIAVPWALLRESTSDTILSNGLLSEFGFGPAASSHMTRSRLTETFPDVPARLLTDESQEWLHQAAFRSFLDGMINTLKGYVEVIFGQQWTIKLAEPAPAQPPADPVQEVIDCFKTSEWSVRWWGIEICLDQACGDKLANLLLAGKADSIAAALGSLVNDIISGSVVGMSAIVAAAIKIFGGAVAAALTAIALYTALMLRANNTPRGVCLVFPWPLTGGLFWWARGR